jgi:hypothetical protein
MRSYNPHGARSVSLGSSLFARHYLGNHSIIFFSSGYLDVSVLRVGFPIFIGMIHLQCTRLSHSEIFGLSLVCSYPKLIAAYHVLHRLLVPRHPPCALIRFKYYDLIIHSGEWINRILFFPYYLLFSSRPPSLKATAAERTIKQKLLSQYVKELLANLKMCKFENLKMLISTIVMFMELNHICCLYSHIFIITFIYSNFQICIFSNFQIRKSGGYRSRTDDPLRARQMLWPAELTPRYNLKIWKCANLTMYIFSNSPCNDQYFKNFFLLKFCCVPLMCAMQFSHCRIFKFSH